MCMNSITIKVLLNLWTKTIANIEKSAIFYLLIKFCFDFKKGLCLFLFWQLFLCLEYEYYYLTHQQS